MKDRGKVGASRENTSVDYVIGEYGELTRTTEPRIATQTGNGQWDVAEWVPTHGLREHTSRLAPHRRIE